jgi:ADP-dependent NAD(P)H-hydrate dehydratase / NAD(P)H-hydrate epimerase
MACQSDCMKVVTVAEMRAIEAKAMAGGVSEAELMGQAGHALGHALGRAFPEIGTAIAFIGKGHNAGDALIALRVLRDSFGWDISIRAAFHSEEWAELTKAQLGNLVPVDAVIANPGPLLLIDGLLGIGAKGAPHGSIADLIAEMNRLRHTRGAVIAAVDLPSGTDPDSGEVFPGAVTADATFMIGAAKRGLLLGRAADATGSLHLVAVAGLAADGTTDMELIAPQTMDFGKSPRPFDFHKGKAGRVAIVAGSPQFSGAALLSALGAIRAGGGLVTLHAPSKACDGIRSRLPLEAMLCACDNPSELIPETYDALVVGPGLGKMDAVFADGLAKLISSSQVPTVIDADALDLLKTRGIKLGKLHLLTPHPGEFARLAPEFSGMPREEAARGFVAETEAVLLLKGARTIIAGKGSALRINSTGTPAMSNGGQGDLLSGVLGALLAGGMKPFDAAALAAWLCGRAAEISASERGSPCTATDTAVGLGLALRDWRCGGR